MPLPNAIWQFLSVCKKPDKKDNEVSVNNSSVMSGRRQPVNTVHKSVITPKVITIAHSKKMK